MGISHEYHSTSHRARHGGMSGKLRLAGVVLAILVLAYAITAILENGASAKGRTVGAGGQRHCTGHSGTTAHAALNMNKATAQP